jgi:hypothetical protein
MAGVAHPILGKLDPAAPGSWDATVAYGGRDVSVDLTIDGDGVTAAHLEALPQEVAELNDLDQAARLAILQDADSGDEDGAALLYITHHHRELSAPDFKRLFGTDRPDLASCKSLLSRLILVRVGLYPESEEAQILLDYSIIDPNATNYLLCVSFDSSRRPTAVDLES